MKKKLKQIGKKLVAGLLSLAMVGTMQTWNVREVQALTAGETGTCGTGVTYKMDASGLLEISGTGNINNYGYTGSPSNYYSQGPLYGSCVTAILINEGITGIGKAAFTGSTNCKSVSIPNTVKYINGHAFRNTGLLKIDIPGSVETIGAYAFYDVPLLTVNFHEGLKTIEEYAFGNGDENIKELVIPDSVESIGDYAFEWCGDLQSLDLGNGLKNIGEYAFSNIINLSSVDIPESVISIGAYAFKPYLNKQILTHLSIPTSVKAIGASAFQSTVTDMELRIVNDAEILNTATYMVNGLAVSTPTVTTYELDPKGSMLNSTGSSKILVSSTNKTDTITVPNNKKAFYVNYLETDGTAITDSISSNLYIAGTDLPSPTKEGYVFDGWYGNAALTGSAITTIEEDATGIKNIYAKWRNDITRESVTVESVEDADYTGSSTIPTVLVKDAGVELTKDVDYTVEVISEDDTDGNTSAGINSGAVTLKITGIGEYANSREAVYNVNKLEGRASLADRYATTYTYNGKSITNPSDSLVTYNNTDADANILYTWYLGDYSTGDLEENALLQELPKNAGTYTLVITVPETRNYKTAEVRKIVNIKKATPQASFTTMLKTFAYCGSNYTMDKPVITLVNNETYDGGLNYYYKTEDSDYKLGLPTNVGTYTVKCVVLETDNYASVETSNTVQLTINKKKATISDGSLKITKVYDGEKAFSLEQTTGSLELGGIVEGDDVIAKIKSISDTDTADVGTKTVALALEITGEAVGNYSFASSNYEFTKATITKANLTVSGIAAGDLVYGETLADSQITGDVRFGTNSVAGTWSFKTPNHKPTVADSEITTYDLVFTPEDTVNFNEVLASTTIVVEKSPNTPDCPDETMEVLYSVKKLSDITLAGKWVWTTDTASMLEVGEEFTATAVYNGSDKGNYVKETCTVRIIRQPCTHPSTELRNVKKTSCSEEGYTGDTYCKQCNELLEAGKTIAKIAHTTVTDIKVDSTCAKTGLTEGSHCSVCNVVLVAQNVIQKKAHTEVTDDKVDSTCTRTGLTEGSHCSVCNTVLVAQEVIAKKAHTTTIDAKVEATCTTSGLTEGSHCLVCNEVLDKQEVIPVKGHCVVTDSAIEATCTGAGVTAGSHCSECDAVLVEQKITPVKPHTWNEGVVEKEPTEIEEGSICYTCTGCGLTMSETIPVKEQEKELAGTKGDANEDGKVDLADAQILLKIALKITTEGELELYIVDVDNSGKVDLADAQMTLKVALKILATFPEE